MMASHGVDGLELRRDRAALIALWVIGCATMLVVLFGSFGQTEVRCPGGAAGGMCFNANYEIDTSQIEDVRE